MEERDIKQEIKDELIRMRRELTINTLSLLNDKYEEVLDIIGSEIKTDNDLLKNRKKVLQLTNTDGDDKLIDTLVNAYGIFWNNIPQEIFEVSSLEDISLRVNQFARYILYIDTNEETKLSDHGYTLLVLFYIKIINKFLFGDV